MKKPLNDGRAKRETEMKIVGQFRAWINHPQTYEKMFGPPMTEFIMRNHMRQTFGRTQLTREDIPPGENWDIPLRGKERARCFWRIVGMPPIEEGLVEPTNEDGEENAVTPPAAEAT